MIKQFVELKIGVKNHPLGCKKPEVPIFETHIVNASRIREIFERTGYAYPMSTVVLDMGTKGHWESRGANSVFESVHVYNTFQELKELLL